MPPTTPIRSRTAHYSPYDLRSRGSSQNPKIDSAPLSLSRPTEDCRALPGDRVTSKGVQPFAVSVANYVPFEVTTDITDSLILMWGEPSRMMYLQYAQCTRFLTLHC